MSDLASASYAEWIGRIVDDRYHLQRILGEGGMGAVFLAEQVRLRKPVAFKIIRPEIAGDASAAARFAREAMATAQIESPHIASAIDYGTLPGGGSYLVTQLARGRPLRAVLHEGGALPWPRAVELAAQVADALVTAHALGIIHRDLKPENIMVGEREDGTPLATVLDFGIASLAHGAAVPDAAAAHGPLTGYGLVIGTPGYMAPEQAVGDKVDARSDLYALGVILWEAISGRPLWEADTFTELVTRQLRELPPPLREHLGAPVPAALDDLVRALLARSPADRPATAVAVRGALRQLITLTPSDLGALAPAAPAAPAAWTPTPAGASTLPHGAAATHPTAAAAAHPTAADDPRRRTNLLLLSGFLLGGLLVGGLALRALTRTAPTANPAAEPAPKSDPKPAKKAGKMSISEPDDDDDDAASEPAPTKRKSRRRLIPGL